MNDTDLPEPWTIAASWKDGAYTFTDGETFVCITAKGVVGLESNALDNSDRCGVDSLIALLQAWRAKNPVSPEKDPTT